MSKRDVRERLSQLIDIVQAWISDRPIGADRHTDDDRFAELVRDMAELADQLILQEIDSEREKAALNQKIAEQKQAEQLLQSEKDLVEQLFESSESAIAQGNDRATVLRINRSFTRIFGYTAEEAVGRQIDELIATEEQKGDAHSVNERVWRRQNVYLDHVARRRKDGSRVYVSLTVSPIVVNDKRVGSYAIWRDVTEQVNNEIELAKYRDHLEELVEKRTAQLAKAQNELLQAAHKAGMVEMANGTLHNVGNVLNSVKTSTEMINRISSGVPYQRFRKANALLRDNMDNIVAFVANDPKGKLLLEYYLQLEDQFNNMEDEIRHQLGRLKRNVDMVVEIIATQQSTGKGKQFTEKCYLDQIVDETLDVQEDMIEQHEITVIKEIRASPVVAVQRTKLIHILINLIRNAKDAMIDTPIKERFLRIAVSADNDRAAIAVTDNGIGVDPQHLEKLFTHGFTTKKRGHGFGLHTCAEYMAEMEGEITADSPGQGQGATFTMRFPLVESVSPPSSTLSPPDDPAALLRRRASRRDTPTMDIDTPPARRDLSTLPPYPSEE